MHNQGSIRERIGEILDTDQPLAIEVARLSGYNFALTNDPNRAIEDALREVDRTSDNAAFLQMRASGQER